MNKPFSNNQDIIELTGTTIRETEKAVLIDFGRDSNVWIPKQFLEDWPDKNKTGEALIEEWIANEKELI